MKKYYVNGEEFDEMLDALGAIMEDGEFEDEFEDFLRDEYGDEVEICGSAFDAVEALKTLDRDEYHDKYNTWEDGKRDDIEMELRRLEFGEVYDFNGCDVEIKDTDAEMFNEAREALSALREWMANAPKLYANNPPMDKADALSAFIDTMEERIMEG